MLPFRKKKFAAWRRKEKGAAESGGGGRGRPLPLEDEREGEKKGEIQGHLEREKINPQTRPRYPPFNEVRKGGGGEEEGITISEEEVNLSQHKKVKNESVLEAEKRKFFPAKKEGVDRGDPKGGEAPCITSAEEGRGERGGENIMKWPLFRKNGCLALARRSGKRGAIRIP